MRSFKMLCKSEIGRLTKCYDLQQEKGNYKFITLLKLRVRDEVEGWVGRTKAALRREALRVHVFTAFLVTVNIIPVSLEAHII